MIKFCMAIVALFSMAAVAQADFGGPYARKLARSGSMAHDGSFVGSEVLARNSALTRVGARFQARAQWARSTAGHAAISPKVSPLRVRVRGTPGNFTIIGRTNR